MSRKQKKIEKKNTNTWMWAGLAILVVMGIIVIAQALRSNGAIASAAAVDAATLPLEVSVTEAAEMRTAGALMLDVRERSEWDEFHMPDARLIPLGMLQDRMNDLPKDRDIVVVCRSGNRSQEGRDILRQAGFTRVTSMDGGMNEWRANGFPTVTGP